MDPELPKCPVCGELKLCVVCDEGPTEQELVDEAMRTRTAEIVQAIHDLGAWTVASLIEKKFL